MSKQRNLSSLLNALGYILLSAGGIHVLLHFRAYVARFHDMSLFCGDWNWFLEQFRRPAALLTYLGRFLTQFCLYPVVAVSMLVAILAVIVFLVRKSVIREARFGAIAALPAVFMFMFISGIGYEVITARADAQIFTQPLGLLSSLLVFGILRKLSAGKYASLTAILAMSICYPLLGAYSLLAVLTLGFWGIFHTEGKKRVLLPAVSLLSAMLVPLLWQISFYTHSAPEYIYLEGLPYLDYSGNPTQLVKLGLSLLLLPLMAIPRLGGKSGGAVWLVVNIGVFAASVAALYVFPERRALFHREMEAEQAIAHSNWKKVLSITATKGVTNDVLVSYRNCALSILGRLPQECWKYSFNTIPIRSGKETFNSSRIAGPAIFYHSGLVNFSSRWASEISLYGTWSVERIQYLAKAALLNEEYGLARKYLATIGRTTLDKSWARKYLAYADNPSKMDDDPEFRRLKALQCYDEKSWYPSDIAAYDVLLFYSFVKGKSREFLEWNLASALLTKSGEWFDEIYPDYSVSTFPVPDEIEDAHHFFSTLELDNQNASDPDKYLFFYCNATVLRPN